ncbi:CapA family protein [Paraliobacillus sediminis]|uniref:CapA family protein n=1 Tax=Paraliobacillus sediminis TaxID=1885916 RepID=UPI000E3BFC60|nr:CapA family protein [Paraliobacillus sediminis]
MKMIVTGDSFISRRLPGANSDLLQLKSLLSQGQVRFTNLEITTHHSEGYPSPFSGGTWAMANPAVLDDLKLYYGFNLYNTANNHTMDYLYGGLSATERELNKRELIHAGAGKTLAAASEPKYLETTKGRVALIGATSTFHPTWIAGNPTSHISGRPGVNPLRYQEINYVTQDQFQSLENISEQTHLDAAEELNRKEGFSVAQEGNSLLFAGKTFKVTANTKGYQKRVPLKEDIDRLIREIRAAKRQSDYVVISLHSHEMTGTDKEKPADFFQEAARRFIDEGAHCVIGHGPHVVRGVEIYRGKPIFYSIGNFIFQNDSVEHLPSDFFYKYGINPDSPAADGYDERSQNGTKGLGVNPKVWDSVIVQMDWDGENLQKIKFYPIELGFEQPRYRKGWPTLTKNESVLNRIQKLSEPYGVDIKIESGVGVVSVTN